MAAMRPHRPAVFLLLLPLMISSSNLRVREWDRDHAGKLACQSCASSRLLRVFSRLRGGKKKRVLPDITDGDWGGEDICKWGQSNIYDVRIAEEEREMDVDESSDYVDLPVGLEAIKNLTAEIEYGEGKKRRKTNVHIFLSTFNSVLSAGSCLPQERFRRDFSGYKAPFPIMKPPEKGFIKRVTLIEGRNIGMGDVKPRYICTLREGGPRSCMLTVACTSGRVIRKGYGPRPHLGMGATLHATGFGKDGDIK
eukprot:1346270-Amorphochlora_amoeboformis.AAC.2